MMYVSTASVCTVGLHVPGPNVSRRSSMHGHMGTYYYMYGHWLDLSDDIYYVGIPTYVVLVRTGRRTDD